MASTSLSTEEFEETMDPRLLLSKMPHPVKKKILEASDFQTILILRRVCRDFRYFIDQGNSLNLRNIYINTYCRRIFLTMTSTSLKFVEIYFTPTGMTTYEVKCGNHSRTIEEKDLLKIFQNELKFLLDHQKVVLNILAVEDNEPTSISCSELIFEAIQNCFTSMRAPLQVEKIRLDCDGNRLKQLLPHCDGNNFKKIEFRNKRSCNVFVITDELRTSNQWNNAREFISQEHVIVGPIQSILHFVKMDVIIENLSVQDLILLRDRLLQSPHFESFKFHRRSLIPGREHWITKVEVFKFDVFVQALGRPSTLFIEDQKQEWYIRIPNSDKYLLISLIASDASFTRVPLSSVPRYAIQ